jgi:hypothetical protein
MQLKPDRLYYYNKVRDSQKAGLPAFIFAENIANAIEKELSLPIPNGIPMKERFVEVTKRVIKEMDGGLNSGASYSIAMNFLIYVWVYGWWLQQFDEKWEFENYEMV